MWVFPGCGDKVKNELEGWRLHVVAESVKEVAH